MNKWWKKGISLLLTLAMVLGVMPGNLTMRTVQAATDTLSTADGIIWLTKNDAGDNVSDEFASMVQDQLLLDDMVREALGITDTKTKVVFEGVNVGSVMDLLRNQDKIEDLIEEMKNAITNKELITFHVGDNAEPKTIAFRSLEGVKIGIGAEMSDRIYIDNAGAPESAAVLKSRIEAALNTAMVNVEHSGVITTEGFAGLDDAANKAHYEATININNGKGYDDLFTKWPTISGSPNINERKAGSVTVTISAAEYDQYQESRFLHKQTIDVYLRDVRTNITIRTMAVDPVTNSVTSDEELSNYVNTYQDYAGTPIDWNSLRPTLDNYNFKNWTSNDGNAMPSTVPEGDVTYFAYMDPKTDNNGNGLADQNEKFTVTYQVSGNDIAAYSDLPYGSSTPAQARPGDTEETQNKAFSWKTTEGGSWQPYVYGDVTYVASWSDGPRVTVSLKVRNQTSEPMPQDTELINHDYNLYQVVDPVWENLAPAGYECTGWYTVVEANADGAQDLNKDGIYAELPFNMNTELDADTNLALVMEFYTISDTNGDGSIEDEYAEGTMNNPLYIYEFVTADGVVTVELNEDENQDSEAPEYGAVGKYQYFDKWEYQKIKEEGFITYYQATAVLGTIESKVEYSAGFESVLTTVLGVSNFKMVPAVDRIDYSGTSGSKRYVAWAEVPGLEVLDENGNYNFSYSSNTEIKVSPIWEYDENGNETLSCYVKAVYVNGAPIELSYDADYIAYGSGYSAYAINAVDENAGDTLEIEWEYAQLQEKRNPGSIAAGAAAYDAETIYNTVMATDANMYPAPAYDPETISVEYLACVGRTEKINLYKLYELFEAEGLGSVLDGFDLPETRDVKLNDKWLSVEANVTEMSAQEVADAYLAKAYQKQKEEKFTNIEEFIDNFLPELNAEIEEKAVHKLGYLQPGVNSTTESLRIIYQDEKYNTVAYPSLTVVEGRSETEFGVTSDVISVPYNEDITAAILNNVEVPAGIDKKDLVTTNGTDIRDFTNAGVGTYTVAVLFKGNTTNKPATSDTFTLTVTKVNPKVTVASKLEIELEGAPDYSKMGAKVTPVDVPIVQVIAGVSAEEFALGENLALVDDQIVIDAMVKLPASYVELMEGLNISELNEYLPSWAPDMPDEEIVEGKYIYVDKLEESLKAYLEAGNTKGADQINQMLDILDQIPDRILERFGLNDLTYTLRIRIDALERKIYPTAPGFYVNYAATLSTFIGGANDNYGTAEDYGVILISPMVPIPNSGGVQLYDGEVSNAQNVFIYEYEGAENLIAHELKVAVNGEELAGATPFYYGLNTRFGAVNEAPTKPGVYFAGYNHTKEEYNEDLQKNEVIRLGSDSAIIIIKPREVDLEIKGATVEHDGMNHIAEVILKDAEGNVLQDKGVTVISGTVNANTNGTNVTVDDLYGTVNVDFPDALRNKWDEYCNKIWGQNAQRDMTPSDVISFLNECADAAEADARAALDKFRELAVHDAVVAALEKANGIQDRVDVDSDDLLDMAARAEKLVQKSREYYDNLIKELKQLENLDNNISMSFYDLATESNELEYSKTGVYLYVGVVTDPDMMPAVGKGLVVIYSEDDYIMYDTHVPYNGKPQNIFKEDTTGRGDVTMTVDREEKEIDIFLDHDLFSAMKEVIDVGLKLFDKKSDIIKDGSNVVVGTVYTKGAQKVSAITDKLSELITEKAIDKIRPHYPDASAELDAAIAEITDKMLTLTDKISAKLQNLDEMPNDTLITVYDMENADDLQGMPVDAGTYEFYGYDYDVAATRGNLIIEPIYILVEDGITGEAGEVITKNYGEDDPEPLPAKVTYYSYQGIDSNQEEVTITELPDGVTEADLVEYTVTRTEGDGAGKYDMTVIAELKETSDNYVLAEREEDLQDFEILPVEVEIKAEVNPPEIYVNGESTLTLSITDVDGNSLDDIVEIGYEINGDPNLSFDTARSQVGEYTITPVLVDSQNYEAVSVESASLSVKEMDDLIRSLNAKALINGTTYYEVTFETITADSLNLEFVFTDNLETASDELYEKYFDGYEILKNGYALTDQNGDNIVDLADALAEVGSYGIRAILKPQANYYANVERYEATLDVVNPSPDTINIWVSLNKGSVFVGEAQASDIVPTLKVKVGGRYITAESTDEADRKLYTDLDPSFKLQDTSGNPVTIEYALQNAGTYYYAITYTPVDGYVVKTEPGRLSVIEERLTVGVTVYHTETYSNQVAVGTDASNIAISVGIYDNRGTASTILTSKYLEVDENGKPKFEMYSASTGAKIDDMQDALDNLGTYVIKPVMKGSYATDYHGNYGVISGYLYVSQKSITVTPVVTYNGQKYPYDKISFKHQATIGLDFVVTPSSFWADVDEYAAEAQEVKKKAHYWVTYDITKGGVEFAEGVQNILNYTGDYRFYASGTTDFTEEDNYYISWGTSTLRVEEVSARAKITPNTEFFTANTDGTYRISAGYTEADILPNLSLSVKDEHGNDASHLITGLKVERIDGKARTVRMMSLDTSQLDMLENPGTYTITTVLVDDLEATGYSNVEPDSITVTVEDVTIGTIDIGDWVMDIDSVIYMKYFPKVEGFSENFDFKNRAGVVIWTGEENPTNRDQLMVGKDNTKVILGWEKSESGDWFIRTHEIYAKNLGDMIYIRPYFIDNDGEYIYLKTAPYYSPEWFSYDVMDEDDSKRELKEKYVCAALLEYGASAQLYFDYKTDSLVNKDVEEYGFALGYQQDYKDDLKVDQHVIDLAKTLEIGENNKTGVSNTRKAALSLAGAIRFISGFDIDTSIIELDRIKEAKVLFWNERDFAGIDSLEYKLHNYSWVCDLERSSDNEEVDVGDYRAKSDYIVAKYLGETVYFTCRIVMDDGTVYNSGLGYYSPDQLAYDNIIQLSGEEGKEELIEVCKRIIVYGEMAKKCFLE